MFDPQYDHLKWRALLTETLPYEVPVIFSNDRLYAALVKQPNDQRIKTIWNKLISLRPTYSEPYAYKIKKSENRYTNLGIVHPLVQLEIAGFYEDYAQTIVDICEGSDFSIRCPSQIVPVYSELPIRQETEFKFGIPHIKPGDGEIDVSRMTSYFSYRRYNLMYKFFESEEFLGLEKRFKLFRQIDVSKCFYNIYTHTVSWAVKDRQTAKKFRNSYSFEAKIDRLMQKANSNETDGIVVGPEFSRIFAEIILQSVDRNVQRSAKARGFKFEVRRYVDDFMIFCNNLSEMDAVEGILRHELNNYKLYVNESKTNTYKRPFVTDLSRARRNISDIFSSFQETFDVLLRTEDTEYARITARRVVTKLRDMRFVVAHSNVEFSNVSGFLLGRLLTAVRQACDFATQAQVDPVRLQGIANALSAMLEIVFYICALDLRVRVTYMLCQFISVVFETLPFLDSAYRDHFYHLITSELRTLIEIEGSRSRSSGEKNDESVELYNLLICGAYFVGEDFLRHPTVDSSLAAILHPEEPLRYFLYITCKFCFLRLPSMYSSRVEQLNERAKNKICSELREDKQRFLQSSESYLLMCDFLGSSEVPAADKRAVLEAALGGSPSNQDAEALSSYLGHTDWAGLRIEHTLRRRELRPVYDWS